MSKIVFITAIALIATLFLSGCIETQPDVTGKGVELKAIQDCYKKIPGSGPIHSMQIDAMKACFDKVFEKSMNAEICEQIDLNWIFERGLSRKAWGGLEVNVRDSCYSKIAFNKKEIELCNKIEFSYSPGERRGECGKRIVDEATKNPNDCLKLGMEEDKSYCLKSIAKEWKEPSVCNKILQPNEKEECQWNVYLETKNYPDCKTFEFNEEIRNQCYHHKAMQEKDVFLCENITENYKISSREGCIADVAYELDDETLCELAANPEKNDRTKYTCYWNFAIRRKDLELCNKLIGSKDNYITQNNCISQVTYAIEGSP